MPKGATETQRKPYLDGLRGYAANIVLVNHLAAALLPSIFAVDAPVLGFLWNGNAAVCIFFVLSGYVLADLAENSQLNFVAQALRRYVRLALPMLLTSTLAWALLACALYHNREAADVTHSWWLRQWYGFEPSFADMAIEALYRAFTGVDCEYNPNLWTMSIELLGSLYIFALNAISFNRIIRFVGYAAWSLYNIGYYYPLIAAGALLFEFRHELSATLSRIVPHRKTRESIALAVFAFAACLCSVPPDSPGTLLRWYTWLPRFAEIDNDIHWHSIGAVLMIAAVLHSSRLQELFANRAGRFLGRISFTVYLIHVPIICSLTALLVVALSALPRPAIALIAGGITMIVVLIVCALLSRLIDGRSTTLSRQLGYRVDSVLRRAPNLRAPRSSSPP
jgi:peptidoglycan/LPS O-acetylase OafA/YrhL